MPQATMASTRRSLPPIHEVGVGIAEAAQVLLVVGQAHVGRGVGSADLPGPVPVGLQQQGLLHAEHGAGAELLAGQVRVLGGHQVAMGAVGALGGQGQHLGAEGGEHSMHRRGRPERRVRGGVHGIQVRAHGGQRLLIVVAAQLLDQGVMADPQPEQHPLGERLGQAFDPTGHRHRVPRPDAGDTCGADQSPGRAQQEGQMGHHVAPGHLRQPDGSVTQVLELRRQVLGLPGPDHVERSRPDPHRGERKV